MQNRSGEEIDLYDLLVTTVKFFKKNFWIFIVCCAVGIGISLARMKSAPEAFTSRMVVQSDFIRVSFADQSLSRINNFITGGEVDSLSAHLGLTAEQSKKLIKVAVIGIGPEKLSSRDSAYIISVETADKAFLPSLQSGIVKYLGSSGYVRASFKRQQEDERLLAGRIAKEIKVLDSLKKSGSKSGTGDERGTVSSEIIELYKQQLQHKALAARTSGVQVIDNFTTVKKVTLLNRRLEVLIGCVAGFVLAFAIIILREIVRIARQ